MYSMTDEGVRSRISVEDLRGELSIQKTVEFLKRKITNLIIKGMDLNPCPFFFM